MDTIFSFVNQEERSNYLRLIMQSFGNTYICLWSHHPPNLLFFWDGFYQEDNHRAQAASSSSGSLARRLFDDYRREVFFAINDRVPGLAFRNSRPYIELNELNLQSMATVDVQRQFYQEARIKTAVFMGCRSGEIELGWSDATQITNMEDKMKNWLPEDFSRQQGPLTEIYQVTTVDPSRPSSSSSSLRSLSMDSPDSSSFLFHIPTTSHLPPEANLIQDRPPSLQPPPVSTTPTTSASARNQSAVQAIQSSPLHQAILQTLQPFVPVSFSQPPPPNQQFSHPTQPHQQAMQAFALTRNVQLPTPESEDATMTRAILTVLTSASSPSTSTCASSNLPYTSPPPQPPSSFTRKASAFKKFSPPLTPNAAARGNFRKLSMLKRAFTYYKSLSIVRREHMLVNRPTSTQLHHMMSERKRREKINESFQSLRSLLPPDAKKDKASVLSLTRESLLSLQAQVAVLQRRNQELEAQLSKAAANSSATTEEASDESSNERLAIRIVHFSEASSEEEEEEVVELRVTVRGECPVMDMVIRILEFLKQAQNVNLMISMEATTTHLVEATSSNRVTFRLRIQGKGWDEAAFQEAVRRVVADLLH